MNLQVPRRLTSYADDVILYTCKTFHDTFKDIFDSGLSQAFLSVSLPAISNASIDIMWLLLGIWLDWYVELAQRQHTWSSEEQNLLTIFICERNTNKRTIGDILQKDIKYIIK